MFWLFFSLLISIAVEWIGLAFWWPEQGAQHAIGMYESELAYLSGDLSNSVFIRDPESFAAALAKSVETAWQWSGLLSVIDWMGTPPEDSQPLQEIAHTAHEYAVATVFVTLVFAVRIAILILSLPLFVLFGLVGLIDGLVERDLRRFSAGRESAYVFHIAKRAMAPMIILAWAFYLSMPFSIHPALVIMPFAVIFAVSVGIAASSFKKYL
jgi:integrating conjugative element membrane protein (TIGR03747 family)